MNLQVQRFLTGLIILAVSIVVLIMGFLLMPSRTDSRSTVEENGSDSPAFSGMQLLEMAASQTAEAELPTPTPTATLLPGMKYWVPAASGSFSPRFTYNSAQWALTDTNTLSSLQISGCTLRKAGGRGLGPDWATEESSFLAGDISFKVVLAKYQGTPQFITYSAPDGTVFEIASGSGFEQCLQNGESILKSMIAH